MMYEGTVREGERPSDGQQVDIPVPGGKVEGLVAN